MTIDKSFINDKSCKEENNICHTFGYGSSSFKDLINAVKDHNIDLIIDIRSYPKSRLNKDFNRDNLELALSQNDIQYIYMGHELGGHPNDVELWLDSGLPNYDKISKTALFRSGILKVAFYCAKRRPLLLCSEKKPEKCHRSTLIAPYLCAQGITVRHITGNLCFSHIQMELFRESLQTSPILQ